MNAAKTLSQEDVERLMNDRSVKTQIQVLEKITNLYTTEGSEALTAEQKSIANDIFGLLLTRAETTVRAMVAMQLSMSGNVPHELAKKMAKDVDEVASPVLQYSDVLSGRSGRSCRQPLRPQSWPVERSRSDTCSNGNARSLALVSSRKHKRRCPS